MLLILIAVLLILGITFFQALQGLFSAMIMALVTLLCTLLAFNFYEPLAATLYASGPWALDYAQPLALMLLLTLPLLGLRFLLDRYLGVNVVPPVWVDRVGGAVFGYCTAMLLVGTLLIAMQMLPLPRSILTYDPYQDNLSAGTQLPAPIDAPGLTLALVETLSAHAMSPIAAKGPSFAQVHDDLELELWGARNRLPGARSVAPPGSLQIDRALDVTQARYPNDETQTFGSALPAYPTAPEAGGGSSRVLLLRAQVAASAAASDGTWRLRGTQFRLVTEDGASFFPVAYLTFLGRWNVVDADQPVGALFLNRPREAAHDGVLTVDLLYRLPEKASGEQREPWFLAFRRLAKAEIPKVTVLLPEPSTPGLAPTLPTDAAFADLALRRNRVQGTVDVVPPHALTGMFFIPQTATASANVPITVQTSFADGAIDQARGSGYLRGDLKGSRLLGRFMGSSNDLRAGGQTYVNAWQVPDGWRMVQLIGRAPQSGEVQMINITNPALLQPRVFVATADGRAAEYPALGAAVRWREAGTDMAMAYFQGLPSAEQDILGVRLEADPLQIYHDNLQHVTEFRLLFLVPENSTVTGFQLTGGGITRMSTASPLDPGGGR